MFDLFIACLSSLDPLWWAMLLPVVGISLSGNYSKSDSNSFSNSGFMSGSDKEFASKTGVNGLANLFTSADDLYRNKAIPQFNMSQKIPGLFQEQEGAATAFANNLFGKASAGGALRGQFSPNNTPGIVGSAITNMGSTLFPIISQNLKDNMLIPEQIRTQRFQNVMSPLQVLINGLGSQSNSSSSAFGTGGGMSTGDGGMGSGSPKLW